MHMLLPCNDIGTDTCTLQCRVHAIPTYAMHSIQNAATIHLLTDAPSVGNRSNFSQLMDFEFKNTALKQSGLSIAVRCCCASLAVPKICLLSVTLGKQRLKSFLALTQVRHTMQITATNGIHYF